MPTVIYGFGMRVANGLQTMSSSCCPRRTHADLFFFLSLFHKQHNCLHTYSPLQKPPSLPGDVCRSHALCSLQGSSVHDFGTLVVGAGTLGVRTGVLEPIPMALYSQQYVQHPCTRQRCHNHLKFKYHGCSVSLAFLSTDLSSL